jgi:2-hydroxyglutarate dehydrogenase
MQYIDVIDYHVDPILKANFFKAIVRYAPEIDANKLQPDYTRIRPKSQATYEGFTDFSIQNENKYGIAGLINLLAFDSAKLISSLAIAE